MAEHDAGTIRHGIDLGTTNSAIAALEGATVSVVKNLDGWDTTPSQVCWRSAEHPLVGRAARDWAARNPQDVAAEFKQEMGLSGAVRRFPRAGIEQTPEQLSALVLRSLLRDVETGPEGVRPPIAVITVPAAFTLNQNEATRRAAVLAGLDEHTPLVQEPTAAAFAYGMAEESERSTSLVFDLGGGTFDAAVVSKRDGELTVRNHDGDAQLGGKLIDRALVEQVVAPAVARQLGLGDFRPDHPDHKADFAILKWACETAKIELSRQDRAEIVVELFSVREVVEYTLTREELDRVAEPFYLRAVHRARAALSDSGVAPGRIERVLLAGSQTLAPGLRELLADPVRGLGIPLDASQDPSTVVARGAALFGGTVRVARPVATPARGRFAVALSYDPTTSEPTAPVAGRLIAGAETDWTGHHVTVHCPEGRPPYHGGPVPVSGAGTFETEVPVSEDGRPCHFTVQLRDPADTVQELDGAGFTMTHTPFVLPGAVLTQSLGIRRADGRFGRILAKGTELPVRSRRVFRTTGPLTRSESGTGVVIPVVEGESARADRNRLVGTLEIGATDVQVNLPTGTEVEVTLEIDASRLVSATATVPLDQTMIELDIDLHAVRPPAAAELDTQLAEAERRLGVLRARAQEEPRPQARETLQQVEDQALPATAREQVAQGSGDLGSATAAEATLRELMGRLDDVEDALELPELRTRLRALIEEAAALAAGHGEATDRRELETLRAREAELTEQSTATELRGLLDRADQLCGSLEARRPDYPVRVLLTLKQPAYRDQLPRTAEVEAAFRDGDRAVADGDSAALRAAVSTLVRMLPVEQRTTIGVA